MANIDLTMLVQGLTDKLAGLFPGVRIFENPSQQVMNSILDDPNGKRLPCFFILARPSSSIKRGINRWFWQPLYELVYLGELYSPTQQQDYLVAAQILDENLETFTAGAGGPLVRTYNRKWTIELQALHYLLDIKQFVRLPAPQVPFMQTYELNQTVKGDDVDVMHSALIKTTTP